MSVKKNFLLPIKNDLRMIQLPKKNKKKKLLYLFRDDPVGDLSADGWGYKLCIELYEVQHALVNV